MNYLIVDLANTFFRARHAAHRAADTWTRLGFAIHVTLSSITKCWREQSAEHVVVCLEGRSWRKDFYPPYKKNRSDARSAMTSDESEEDQLFWKAFDDLKNFISENSNCTVLQHAQLEADDLIAGWIQHHPQDQHVIVSSDSDFYQLLAANVKQYNGVTDELHTLEGIFDRKGKPIRDKKTGELKTIPDPAWLLFEKCMRGDTSDNVFSAYPGVRKKGSSNKVGLVEAYADRASRGWAWNNLMLQTWCDHLGQEHRVLDDYRRNVTLIDLSAQPDEVKQQINATISAAGPKAVPQIGSKFLKFCGKYDLVKLSENATATVNWLGKSL